MHQFSTKAFGLLLTSLLFCAICFGQTINLNSPNGRLLFYMSVKDNMVYYNIKSEGQVVVQPSSMGLLVNGKNYKQANSLSIQKQTIIKNTFVSGGVHSSGLHYATVATVQIKSKEIGKDFSVDIQVFNDGVAFRYNVPSTSPQVVTQDLTQFVFPAKTIAWWQSDVRNYEGTYKKNYVTDIKDKQIIGLPITFELLNSKKYVAINEAGLGDFAGFHLVKTDTNAFKSVLASDVKQSTSIKSSWRVIQIAADLNTLVNSDIIASLAELPDPKLFPQGFNTKWIRPGKSVWSWMTPRRTITPENMRQFTDLAAQLNIPYNLVDEGWSKWKTATKDSWQLMKDLVDYSKPKKVDIWVWVAYPDNNGITGLKDSTYMVDFFQKCKAIGVVGLKVDFMSSETQDMMAFYIRALREAAKLHLMIDFHGANKPTGLNFTWPNEMTREAVRGLEYEGNTDYPAHNTVIPFTRYLAGCGDYTPMSFQPYVSNTTLAHQVATSIIFTSPLLVLGVDPLPLLKSPALPFIKQTPTVWDETVVLPCSRIGEIAGFARRSGNKWFVAILNNKDKKELSIPLSFLSKGKYSYISLSDNNSNGAPGGKAINSGDNIKISLASGGGFVGIFDIKK